ncbi:BTB domain and ankyrin repeat protein [Taphrina deformans PYCC 5710]|uniref:BTB domain and ankyrin repeat protein n=1 Tax=Taphrina deformans (strain PYCC 5710 / ATCC 11124 / CBS 356.35 / IMI 108563 / JCM 9778 / NBRC 8474) TaxID=1097556 RepID=R4XFW2_TAPDE|nr:BTB domain and ankyrin repeat protein [Taphrina deformans PYCC 5710]|eukprot:CCG82259.1 BTB domain and ankyrin repeat protein [Taphrina deformans PYCC 5710]
MSLLHAYLTEDFKTFDQLLRQDAETTIVRNGKQKATRVDVNAVDYLGRTILHLAASDAKDEYLKALSLCKSIDLGKQDRESGWTALHRALYSGNVLIARYLLGCKSIKNTSRKDLVACTDFESNTAFDVYNATVSGVNPPVHDFSRGGSDLYTFGSNANHTLGFSDADDRAFPERVNLRRARDGESNSQTFKDLRIRDVFMAKYHTIILTTDATDNLLACGFAKNGRLGIGGGTQFTFQPISIPGQVTAVAVAQDHSLAVTKTGDIYAWGSNVDVQLGYEVENGQPFSTTPRKIIKLARETVLGVAASSIHSVCFTEDSLFTWGRNEGALGYEIIPQEGKLVTQPRKVTSLSTPVKQVTATRFATICLLETHDVIVYTNFGYFKLSLQLDRFASQYQVFRPKQAYAPSSIVKVVSGAATVAVMTSMGDVFSFVLDESTTNIKPVVLGKTIKPGRTWSLRKKHMAARDVAVGQEGTIIMCTESGNAYIGRSRGPRRNLDSTKNDYKFTRVHGITRVVQVRGNESGAFGVIREDVQLSPIRLDATSLAEDVLCLLPYANVILEEDEVFEVVEAKSEPDGESETDAIIAKHIQNANSMLRSSPVATSSWEHDEESYDTLLRCGHQVLPAHKMLCCTRSAVLAKVLNMEEVIDGCQVKSDNDVLTVTIDPKKYSFEAIIIVMHWLYSDIVLSPWFGASYQEQKRLMTIKDGALALATVLKLKPLINALAKSFVVSATQTIATDFSKLLDPLKSTVAADMRLLLQDGEILTHSTILACRSEFFGAMISGAWIDSRRSDSPESAVSINVKHITCQVMRIVLQHIFCDEDHAVFESVEVSDLDDYLDLIISVMAASAELLLPRLKQACQAVLARHIYRKNVAIILHEADRYSADELKEGCLEYCAKNLQFLLEKDLLADLDDALMHDLELLIARKQIERLPISKSGSLLSQLIQRNPRVLDESDVLREKYLASLLKITNEETSNPSLPNSQSMSRKASTPGRSKSKASPLARPETAEDSSLMFDMDAYDLSDVSVVIASIENENVTPETNVPKPSDTVTSSSLPSVEPIVTENTPHLLETRSPRGWKANKIVQPVTDLRSVLSDSLSQPAHSNNQDNSWSPVANNKASQKERKRQLQELPSATSPAASLVSASPWASKKSAPVTPFMSIAKSQESPGNSRNAALVNTTSPSPRGSIPVRRPSATPHSTSLPKSSGSYSKTYLGTSASLSAAPIGKSLGEIIAAEEAAKTKMVEYNAKRSMKEIQEQEAFELWFSKETARVKQEEEASAALALKLAATGSSQRKSAGKKANGKAPKTKNKPNTPHRKSEPVAEEVSKSTVPVTTFRQNPAAEEFRPRSKTPLK